MMIKALDTERPSVDWLSPVGDGEQMIITVTPEDQLIQLEVSANDNTEIEQSIFTLGCD